MIKYPKIVIVEHGSHVNNPEKANDIDVIYAGSVKIDVIAKIVRNIYPNFSGSIDIRRDDTREEIKSSELGIILNDPSNGEIKKVHIPAPCDAEAPYRIIYKYPIDTLDPDVKVVRFYNNIISILRENAPLDKTIERIYNTELQTIQLTKRWTKIVIEEKTEEDSLEEKYMSRFEHNYSGSLTSLRKAVNHFGKSKFILLCRRLWWGDLLQGLVECKIRATSLQCIRNACSGHTARLFIEHEKQKIHLMYGNIETICGSTINEWCKFLFVNQ